MLLELICFLAKVLVFHLVLLYQSVLRATVSLRLFWFSQLALIRQFDDFLELLVNDIFELKNNLVFGIITSEYLIKFIECFFVFIEILL